MKLTDYLLVVFAAFASIAFALTLLHIVVGMLT